MDSSSALIGHDYTEIYSRVPYRLQLAYGVGHVLNDVCASMWFTYLLVFFHLVLEFSNWQAGLVLLVGQIADGLATPFVGYQSDLTDNSWLCRYGRRKTWHLVGTLCVIFSFPFIFAPCPDSHSSTKSSQLFYYCMFVIIFQFGWASVQISHLSLIPEITPNEHDRTKLTAIRYGFTVISNVLVYVITWFALHIDDGGSSSKIGPGDTWKFQEVVWCGLGVGIIASLTFHICVKEGNHSGNDVRGGQQRVSVGNLLCSVEVYQVAVIYMSTRMFVNLSQIFIPLYLHETLEMAASALALIPLVMFVGSFLTSLVIERINRGFGRKLSYLLGAAMGIAACVWIQVRSGEQFVTYDIYAVAVLFGVGGSIILVTSLGITADLIGDKTGSGAFVYGIMSFCDKFANGIAVIIIQDLHKAVETTYYRDVITYACGGSALLGAIAVISLMNRLRDHRDGYESIPGDSSINTDLGNDVPQPQQPSLIT